MAHQFKVLRLEPDEQFRRYYAQARFQGRTEDYELTCTNGCDVRLLGKNLGLMITVDEGIPDGEDKDDGVYLTVRGLNSEAQSRERKLEEALIDYAFNQ